MFRLGNQQNANSKRPLNSCQTKTAVLLAVIAVEIEEKMSIRKSKRLEKMEPDPISDSPIQNRRYKIRTSADLAKTPRDFNLFKKSGRKRKVLNLLLPEINDIYEEKIDNIKPSRSSVDKDRQLKSALKTRRTSKTSISSCEIELVKNDSEDEIDKKSTFEIKANAEQINDRRSTFELEESTVGKNLLPNVSVIDLTESICENKENIETKNDTYELENSKYSPDKTLPKKTPSKVKFNELVQTKPASIDKNESVRKSGRKSSLNNTKSLENEANKKNNSTFDIDKSKPTPRKNNSTFDLQESLLKDNKTEISLNVTKDNVHISTATNKSLKNNSTFELDKATLINTPGISFSKQVHFNTPPSGTSTPAIGKATGLSTKRQSGSFSEKILKPKPAISKSSTKRKLPNFAKIHQKALDKLESVDDYVKRKEERAKLLMSGQKPLDRLNSNTEDDLIDTKIVKAKKQLPFENNVSKSESITMEKNNRTPYKSVTTALKELNTFVKNLSPIKSSTKQESPVKQRKTRSPVKTPKREVSPKKTSPRKSSASPTKKISKIDSPAKFSNKVATPGKQGFSKPKTPGRKPILNKVPSRDHLKFDVPQKNSPLKNAKIVNSPLKKAVLENGTFKKLENINFGQKKAMIVKPVIRTKSPIKFVKTQKSPKENVSANITKKIEQIKSVATKTQTGKPKIDQRRDAIKGVRSNRRFDLLMKMRNLK